MEKERAEIVDDNDGQKIVLIKDTLFRGRRRIDWDDVRDYIRSFSGTSYVVEETGDEVNMGLDVPNEYSGSNYTYSLKGAAAKAKANAAQCLPEMIQIARNPHFRENDEEKHARNAKFGWYRYDSRFAVPIYDDNGGIERYNEYHASLLVRHDENGKKYLYDVIDIKKETSNPLGS